VPISAATTHRLHQLTVDWMLNGLGSTRVNSTATWKKRS
jgi:hypothetical protein